MIATLLVALLTATPPGATAKAEALTRRAIVEYNGRDFDEALADLKSAYGLRPAPGLLFDMGQCQRALHHWREAADALRAYLRERPKAKNRATVEVAIADLERRGNEKLRGEQAPSPTPDPASSPTPPSNPESLPALEELSPTAAEAPDGPATPSPLQKSRRIAVLDVRAYGSTSQDLAQAVSTVVLRDVRERAADSTVVGSDEIRALLGLARGKSLPDCPGGSCLAGIGEALSTDRVVLGSLNRLGNTYLLDLQLFDAASGSVLASSSARFKQEGALPGEVDRCVQVLFAE